VKKQGLSIPVTIIAVGMMLAVMLPAYVYMSQNITYASPGVEFRSVGVSPGTDDGHCVIAKPTGLTEGDLMIAHIVIHANVALPYAEITPPANWTQIRLDQDTNYIDSGLYWKIADSNDVSASNFTFEISKDFWATIGAITAWTGHNTENPIGANNGQINEMSTTVTSPGITPPVANSMILLFCGVRNDNTHSNYAIANDNPESWSEGYDIKYDGTRDVSCAMGYALRTETSETGNGTATTSSSQLNVGQLLAITPAVAAPTVTTMICSGFDRDWAIVNGYIDIAVGTITTVGFDYGLTDAYGSSITKSGTWTTAGPFWARIPNLTPSTVYHYRAKAYNGIWGYGSDRVFSTEGSPTLYEYLNTNGDADGDDIYAGNWSYMQFTVGSVSHSLDFANIYVKRTGSPGPAILSLKNANDANKPTGADLDALILNGDNFSDAMDWVKYDFPEDITLEAGASYALVLRCPNGTVTDYLEWRWDAGGSLADAVAGKSTDSGINWTVDAGGADYLFEIWGEPVLEVVGAHVFSGYLEDDDWLIVLTYQNRTTPYYPNEDAGTYFNIQFIDDETLKAQVNCPSWGYKAASIYISKSLADTLEWGNSDYKIRIRGNYDPYPFSDYNLTTLDWKGEELSFLDTWVITQADIIGEYYETELTTTVATLGKVLNSIGGTIFVDGIPGLNTIRPNLFELAIHKDEYTETEWGHDLQTEADWEVRLGPTISGMLTNMGNWIGVDGKGVGGIIAFLAFIVVVIGLSIPGHFAVGLGLGYPFLAAGAWFGVVDYVLLGVTTFLAVVLFIYKVWLVK